MIDIKTSYIELRYDFPLPVRGKIIETNRFLKVTVLENDYFISILPGFHDPSLAEIDFKLKHFFSHYELHFDQIDFTKKFFNLITQEDAFLKSVKTTILFNIEAVLLGMIKTTHPHLIPNFEPLKNDLYNETNDHSFYKLSNCLKIKIAPNSVKKTIHSINEIFKENPTTLYRLDGNRRFELDEMIIFEQHLKDSLLPGAFLRIDYLEEPFKNFYDSFLFNKRSLLKLAIDESFINYINYPPLNFPAVIKPSLIGISPVYSWLRFHQESRAIISSSFEHPTILLSLNFLASLRPSEFHGLENFLTKDQAI